MYKHCPTTVAIVGFCLAIAGFVFDWYMIPMLTERAKKVKILISLITNIFFNFNKCFCKADVYRVVS